MPMEDDFLHFFAFWDTLNSMPTIVLSINHPINQICFQTPGSQITLLLRMTILKIHFINVGKTNLFVRKHTSKNFDCQFRIRFLKLMPLVSNRRANKYSTYYLINYKSKYLIAIRYTQGRRTR